MRGLLYRSPDVLIDGAVWHVVVLRRQGTNRVITQFRFRRSIREMWQPVANWPGPLPKGIGHRFRNYRRSVKVAEAGADLLAIAIQGVAA
jgi:hypothetical protein